MSQPKVPSPAEDAGRAKWFWPAAGIVAILLVMIQSREISRPFYGLHSWAQAHGAWLGRVHAKYGFGYTKGLATWAVGEPPPEPPRHYLDHPQLLSVLTGVECSLFGYSETPRRVLNIVRTLLALFLIVLIFRRLADDRTALLAALLYVLLPVIGYFGAITWVCPMNWLAIWAYLAAIGAYRAAPGPKRWHKWVLGGAELLAPLMSWDGFFFCLAIGVHYVARCIVRRQWPQKALLAILIAAPTLALAINFTVMAAGWGWDVGRMVELFVWRSSGGTGMGELPYTWAMWWSRFWEFAETNFTWAVMVPALVYVGLAPIWRLGGRDKSSWKQGRMTLHLPGLGLLLLPAVFQLLILKAALRPHQYWERPLSPFLVMSAALVILEFHDAVRSRSRALAVAAMCAVMGIVTVACAAGVNHYFYIRWQAPAKIEMLKKIRSMLKPDEALLSFEAFTIEEHKAKGKHYRPEIAYYLDREIIQAYKPDDILAKAASGKSPLYLMPVQLGQPEVDEYLKKLAQELVRRYRFVQIPGEKGEVDIETDAFGRVTQRTFHRAGMPTYLLFDLRAPAGRTPGSEAPTPQR